MMKITRNLILLILVAGVSALLAGCGDANGEDSVSAMATAADVSCSTVAPACAGGTSCSEDADIADVSCSAGESISSGGSSCCPSKGGMSAKITESATMGKVYTSEKLYTCPGHPALVDTDPDDKCPLHKAPLREMTAADVTELRSEELLGCTMCPVVKPATAEKPDCILCGMKLIEIKKG
ncbi:MAG: hypothetical protein GY835_14765 [bacterium]|nr:hypothetical protein [bacterium]